LHDQNLGSSSYSFFFLFSSTKLDNRRVKLSCPGGQWYQWEAVVAGKWHRMVNMAKKYVHMYVNVKMIPVETIPRTGWAGI
jgi:hypothetical protein